MHWDRELAVFFFGVTVGFLIFLLVAMPTIFSGGV